jgi:hypothetical protein
MHVCLNFENGPLLLFFIQTFIISLKLLVNYTATIIKVANEDDLIMILSAAQQRNLQE